MIGIKKKTIGIVFPQPYFDSVPSLRNAAILLANAGYNIEIFTIKRPGFHIPEFDDENISITMIEGRLYGALCGMMSSHSTDRNNWGLRIQRLLYLFISGCALVLDKSQSNLLPIIILMKNQRKKYCCFIGVDPRGLVIADRITRLIKSPLIYYSLELLIFSEISNVKLGKLKQTEVNVCKRVYFAITQDNIRAKILSDENNIPMSNIVTVPNGPLGLARIRKNDYWHQKFKLDPNSKIVLYVGSFDPWNGVQDIIQSVPCWPPNWYLVLHSFYDEKMYKGNHLFDSLVSDDQRGRVLFSFNPVRADEYEELIDGADVGIAFYLPCWVPESYKNIETMGLSSGKVAYYLHAGLPVIVNTATTLSDNICEGQCGISVSSSSEIAGALSKIEGNYEFYSNHACKYFNTEWNFAENFHNVIHELHSRSP